MAWGLGCGETPLHAPSPEAAPLVDTPAIDFAHCRDVTGEGACVTTDATTPVHVWIDQPAFATVEVRVNERSVPVRARAVGGGTALEVELDAEARDLTITGVRPRWRTPWHLAVVHEPRSARLAEASRASTPAAREAAATDLRASLPGLAPTDRLATLEVLRGLASEGGRVREEARTGAEVVALARRLGRRRALARAANSLVHLHVYRLGELERAPDLLATLDEAAQSLAEARVWRDFARGIVARRTGDPTEAIARFSASAALAERLGMSEALRVAREGLGVTYGELGRAPEAMALVQQMLDAARDPAVKCPLRYAALNTAGWVQLVLAQQTIDVGSPTEVFEEALALVQDGGECPRWDDEVNVRINLGLAALGDDAPDLALAWLEPIDLEPPGFGPWVDEVRARAGLALARWDLLPPLIESPSPALPPALRYNAWMGLGAARQRFGMHEAAIEAFTAAEAIVDETMQTIGIDLGRELFLSGRQQSVRSLVDALVAEGRPGEALCAARRARGRALRQLDRAARLSAADPERRAQWLEATAAIAADQRALEADSRDAWTLSAAEFERHALSHAERRRDASRRLDEAYRRLGGAVAVDDCADLPAPRVGEATIVVLPLDATWAVFVATASQVHANRVAPADATGDLAGWSRLAFAGAEDLLEGAERLRILPMGRSAEIDFHALPWGDGILLDLAPVEYALDLPPRATRDPRRTAVVVSDPSGDLPLARDEADAVESTLRAAGWAVTRREGTAVSRDELARRAAAAAVFHYAGHGEHGGVAGWDARLRLGGDSGLGVTEILALPGVPRGVVLSGCETGRVADDTLEGGMSLARAFVLAGSDWVVASDRDVPDTLAAALGARLYEQPSWDERDAAPALRDALRSLREDHPAWATFRVVVP